jgi:hypothetical protein
MAPLQITRDAFGRLVLVDEAGVVHEGVTPVRAFPITAPGGGVALVSTDGHEAAWIEDLATLPVAMRALVEEDLAAREFTPEIRRLVSVSSFATPSIWEVETDRGDTAFVLKGEEDIRRLGRTSLLIADSFGVQFLVRDIAALDKASRRLLDRFL